VDDRELLELAAKAAGIDAVYEKGYLTWFDRGRPFRPAWKPLTDDGDALALAVRVFLTVGVEDGFTEVLTGIGMAITESHNGDALSATRRAIVRAAAEIGRSMNGGPGAVIRARRNQ